MESGRHDRHRPMKMSSAATRSVSSGTELPHGERIRRARRPRRRSHRPRCPAARPDGRHRRWSEWRHACAKVGKAGRREGGRPSLSHRSLLVKRPRRHGGGKALAPALDLELGAFLGRGRRQIRSTDAGPSVGLIVPLSTRSTTRPRKRPDSRGAESRPRARTRRACASCPRPSVLSAACR